MSDYDFSDTFEVAEYLSDSYGVPLQLLVTSRPALALCFARWMIRGDQDPEALSWIRDLAKFLGFGPTDLGREACVILEQTLLPVLEAFVASPAVLVLPE